MANRSDHRTAKLPRRWKRMLTLTSTGDKHQDGIIRRLFIGAHAHALKVEPLLPLHKHSDVDLGEAPKSDMVKQAEAAVQA